MNPPGGRGPALRHPAAIMFTDMAGYTALLGGDDEAARQVRERHRTSVEKAIGGQGGTIVNRMGDGTARDGWGRRLGD